MVVYHLVIKKKALEFLNALPLKSQRIVIEKCKTLADDPFPGQCNKEIIQRRGHKDIYRLHISRSYIDFIRFIKMRRWLRSWISQPLSKRMRYMVGSDQSDYLERHRTLCVLENPFMSKKVLPRKRTLNWLSATISSVNLRYNLPSFEVLRSCKR